jgi:hypothetical protein
MADIVAVDDYAKKHNRQGLEFSGTVNNTGLITDLENKTIDVLLVYTYIWYSSDVFPVDVQSAVAAALANGKLKKLMVW